MAECGIKKYDELPARIGLTDVDNLRAYLIVSLKKNKTIFDRLLLFGYKTKEILIDLELARENLKTNKKWQLQQLTEEQLLELE